MILVDIYAPQTGKTYDFTLDEKAAIGALIEEIGEMICQRERWPKPENAGNLMLCSLQTKQILPESSTLAGLGIRSGSRLMLL